MRKLAMFGIIPVIVFCATFSYGGTVAYEIDSDSSELVVRMFRGGFAFFLGHNHVIRATEFSGQISFDPDDDSSAEVSVVVKTASLKADEPQVRARYELEKQVNDKDRKQIQKTMESVEQLDIKKFPVMVFKSTKIEKQDKDKYKIRGDLTIHGVTLQVSTEVKVEKEGIESHIRGVLKFKQSDFGIKPYSAAFGSIRNKDEVVLHIDLVVIQR